MLDPYLQPESDVLRNKFGIDNHDELLRAERLLVTARMMGGVPEGGFDLAHLQAIHGHLFQDVYDWAGDIRTMDIAKGASRFQPARFIEVGMADIHRRVVKAKFLRQTSAPSFARQAGQIIGDINYLHPFREGNGRTQLQYLKQLAQRAGHKIDLSKLEREPWIEASKEAFDGRYEAMSQAIYACLESREHAKVQHHERVR